RSGSMFGAITATAAPASRNALARRTATGPPPTMTQRLPWIFSMTGRGGMGLVYSRASVSSGLAARDVGFIVRGTVSCVFRLIRHRDKPHCYHDPMPDLWEETRQTHLRADQPLAVRMRPRSLDEFAGQAHFLGEGKLLRRMLS